MNLIRHIITAVYKSLYDLTWVAAQRTSLFRACAFLTVFLFVLVVTRGWTLAQTFSAEVGTQWSHIEQELPDFTVAKSDTGLSVTGLEQPFTKEFTEDGDRILVYIDTASTSSISMEDVLGEDAERYAVLLTSQKVKFYDKDVESTETEDLSQLPHFSLTKHDIGEELTRLQQKLFPWLFLFLSLVLTLVLGIGKLIYVLLPAWLIYIVTKSDKQSWTFWQVYTIGIYAMVLPTMMQYIFTWLSLSIPFVYSIVTVVMMYLVVTKGRQSSGDIATE